MLMIRELTETFGCSWRCVLRPCFLFVLAANSFACLLSKLFFRNSRKIAWGRGLTECFLLLGTSLLALFFGCEACFVARFAAVFVNAFVLVFLVLLSLSRAILLLRLVSRLDSFCLLITFVVISILLLINDFLRFGFVILVV